MENRRNDDQNDEHEDFLPSGDFIWGAPSTSVVRQRILLIELPDENEPPLNRTTERVGVESADDGNMDSRVIRRPKRYNSWESFFVDQDLHWRLKTEARAALRVCSTISWIEHMDILSIEKPGNKSLWDSFVFNLRRRMHGMDYFSLVRLLMASGELGRLVRDQFKEEWFLDFGYVIFDSTELSERTDDLNHLLLFRRGGIDLPEEERALLIKAIAILNFGSLLSECTRGIKLFLLSVGDGSTKPGETISAVNPRLRRPESMVSLARQIIAAMNNRTPNHGKDTPAANVELPTEDSTEDSTQESSQESTRDDTEQSTNESTELMDQPPTSTFKPPTAPEHPFATLPDSSSSTPRPPHNLTPPMTPSTITKPLPAAQPPTATQPRSIAQASVVPPPTPTFLWSDVVKSNLKSTGSLIASGKATDTAAETASEKAAQNSNIQANGQPTSGLPQRSTSKRSRRSRKAKYSAQVGAV